MTFVFSDGVLTYKYIYNIIRQKEKIMNKIHAFAFASMVLCVNLVYAVNVEHLPHTITQPDGSVFDCFLSGDEFHMRMFDVNDYTIIQDPQSGYYVYARLEADLLVPTNIVAGRIDPTATDLIPGIDLPAEKIRQQYERFPYMGNNGAFAPPTGTINNIVVYIRFADQTEFTDSVAYYNRMFNNSSTGTSSMYNYFIEASYNNLFVYSYFYPTPPGAFTISYQDSHNRNYYIPYNSSSNPEGYQTDLERRMREHGLLRDAVNAIASQVPSGLNIDADNDGRVDNIVFVIRGDHTSWADLLWPHRWALYTYNVYINSKQVWDYNLQLEMFFKQHSDVGVLCHEMGHSVGYPDLYHYYYGTNLSPCGSWDVMCSSPNPPTHMGAYMKYYYTGWISAIPEITVSGTYWIKPILSTANNCYRIASPNSSAEYFVVEYRRRITVFENSLPGSGLLVYRINSDFAGQGNAQYDGTSIFDEVYIYRPNGTPTTNGSVNSAHFSADVNRTAINDTTNPYSFLHDGSPGGLSISSISAVGDSMSFYVTIPAGSAQEPDQGIVRHGLPALKIMPNPTCRAARITYILTEKKNVELAVYNTAGELVKSLYQGDQPAGEHFYIWDGKDRFENNASAGVYFCRLSIEAGSSVHKLVKID